MMANKKIVTIIIAILLLGISGCSYIDEDQERASGRIA